MICGFGIYDGKRGGTKNNIIYSLWSSMIKRCYDKKYTSKNPSYIGTTVCDEWKYYSNFEKWAAEKYIRGYVLDKDIISGDLKIYSPVTCSFIPPLLNTCIALNEITNKKYPLGVSYKNKTSRMVNELVKPFYSQIKEFGKVRFLGMFENPNDAHKCWQHNKIIYLKKLKGKYYNLSPDIINGIEKRIKILENDLINNKITVNINKV